MPSFRSGLPVLLALAAVLAGATPAPPSPIGLTIQTHRESLDLLDGVFIEVVAHNPSTAIRTVEFAQPTEYEIDVLHNGEQLWSSLPASPPPGQTYVAHARAFNAGATPVVIYDWNEVTAEHSEPASGEIQGSRDSSYRRASFVNDRHHVCAAAADDGARETQTERSRDDGRASRRNAKDPH